MNNDVALVLMPGRWHQPVHYASMQAMVKWQRRDGPARERAGDWCVKPAYAGCPTRRRPGTRARPVIGRRDAAMARPVNGRATGGKVRLRELLRVPDASYQSDVHFTKIRVIRGSIAGQTRFEPSLWRG